MYLCSRSYICAMKYKKIDSELKNSRFESQTPQTFLRFQQRKKSLSIHSVSYIVEKGGDQ